MAQTNTHTLALIHTHTHTSINTYTHAHTQIQFLIREGATEVNWNGSTVKKKPSKQTNKQTNMKNNNIPSGE